MAVVESFFATVGTWFGFVGSCVAGADSTCRPFVAFVALTIASGVALALVITAYRSLQPENDRQRARNRRERLRQYQIEKQARRAVSAKVAPRAAPHRGWRMPA